MRSILQAPAPWKAWYYGLSHHHRHLRQELLQQPGETDRSLCSAGGTSSVGIGKRHLADSASCYGEEEES
jgi:hypothetical protein